LKQYPLRYQEELQGDIDFIAKPWDGDQSKNQVIQACIQIAAGSVKKIIYGHSKKDGYEKRELIKKQLKLKKLGNGYY